MFWDFSNTMWPENGFFSCWGFRIWVRIQTLACFNWRDNRRSNAMCLELSTQNWSSHLSVPLSHLLAGDARDEFRGFVACWTNTPLYSWMRATFSRSSSGVLNPDFPSRSSVTEATSCLCRIYWTILASKKQTRTTLCVPSVTLPFQWSEGSWWLLSDGNNFLNLKWSVNKFGVSSSPPPSSFVQLFQRKNYCARLAWGKPGCPQKQPRGRHGGQEDVPCSWGRSEGDQDSHCCSCFYS